ncbi:MAG: TadE/TadG family type IV pilus assembly protein [bacterium]
MNPKNFLSPLKYRIRRTVEREDGSSIIELAIVFPILMILFVGTAELGRLFYTYTTLAKATTVGARYLSTSRKATGKATEIALEKTIAKNLVVYGCKDRTVTPCSTATSIVPGLSTANVNICDNFSVPCNPVLAAPSATVPKHFRVEIQSYNYSRGVWNLATMTGQTNSTFYFPLRPGTEMRYMP